MQPTVNSCSLVGLAGRTFGACVFFACALAVSVAMVASPACAGDGRAAVNVSLLEDAADRIVINYELGDFTLGTVTIDGRQYTTISLGKESPIKVAGAPELPNVCRSIIIPGDAEMAVRVVASTHYDVTDISVAPSKGFILRNTNPADVPYTFGGTYNVDAFYPGKLATLREPYILRDHRGVVVEINPFQYNPVTRILRVYKDVTLEVVKVGPGRINVLHRRGTDRDLSLAFHEIYGRHFLNYLPPKRYTPLDETGDMLIICHDAWLSNIQPLVDHKNAIGISTTVVGVSTIGNDPNSIKNHIQNVYDSGDLAFVLLVGDASEVASPQVTVDGETESADPTYALVAGSDHYPDILVGRFSAESAADVDTQVERTIEYEELPATGQAWFKKGTGVASDLGPGDDDEYDFVHIGYIRDDLLAYGYTEVDEIYDPGATAAQVTAALNAGRGIINYCGHGLITSWGTTGFSNSNIDALTNDNMLPFIISVACNNGTFDGDTCFAEAWLRATNGSEPTGAIGIYASSILQDWYSPMCAQDEVVDMLVAEAYFSFGGLCFAGSCQMMDEYGPPDWVGQDMFDTWHVFGDPSLRVFGAAGPPDPTSTPTTTPTSTPAMSPTPTATFTNTPSRTPTGTPTVTDTPTRTPTITITPTVTPTPTVTSTPTVTPTGVVRLAVLKKEGVSDVNLYYYNSLVPGDWAYWDARARNPSPYARDLWVIPTGNDAIGIAAVKGEGWENLCVLKKEGAGDVNLYLYNSLVGGDWTYWDARARNPSQMARDLWIISAGNDAIGMASMDITGDETEELAILKKEGVGDVNIYYYNALVVGDWTYWDAKARNPSPVARDLWVLPRGNDAIGLTAIDVDGGSKKLAIMKKEGVSDINLYYYQSLVVGDWTYWDAKARNPSPLARDLWVVPVGNDAIGLAAIDVDRDGREELSILKKEGVGDVNIYYYGSLVAGDWAYWDAKSRNPSPLIRDLWVIPRGNDAVGITAIMTE